MPSPLVAWLHLAIALVVVVVLLVASQSVPGEISLSHLSRNNDGVADAPLV